MVVIEQNQVLEIKHLASFRGRIRQDEIERIGKELEEKVEKCGAKRAGYPITATYAIEGDIVDIELLLPVDQCIENIETYEYKEKIKIVNAVVAHHRGNPQELNMTCNKLNQYIVENKLVPITAAYNITKKIDLADLENTEIDVYVGISHNIL